MPGDSWDGEENSLPSNPGFLWAVDLYNHGYYWEAHEAWEHLWKRCERDAVLGSFLQGLIQCAGAALKASMEQPEACQRLADRGLAKLLGVAGSFAGPRLGLDIRGFASEFREFSRDPSKEATAPKLLIEVAP